MLITCAISCYPYMCIYTVQLLIIMHMYGLELMVMVDNHARLISWYLAVGLRDITMHMYTFIRWVLL